MKRIQFKLSLRVVLLIAIVCAVAMVAPFWIPKYRQWEAQKFARTIVFTHSQFRLEDYPKLASFDPANGTNSIWLSYEEIPRNKLQVELTGKGVLLAGYGTNTEVIGMISQNICRNIFVEVLTNGFLDYDEHTVFLKSEKLGVPMFSFLSHDPDTFVSIHVSVPEFHVEKWVTIIEPEAKPQSWPDIVEFHLFLNLEKRLKTLSPEYEKWRQRHTFD